MNLSKNDRVVFAQHDLFDDELFGMVGTVMTPNSDESGKCVVIFDGHGKRSVPIDSLELLGALHGTSERK